MEVRLAVAVPPPGSPRAPLVDLFPSLFPRAPERPLFAEPRKRLGGKGVTPWDAGLAIVPSFELGIPNDWVLDDKAWTLIGCPVPGSYVPFDRADAPTFQSQADYLRERGLLTATELRRLRDEDYAPEKVEFEEERSNQ